MLRAFEPWHLLIIGGVATVLFGAKRLPDSARSLGQSLRILKSEAAAGTAGNDQSALAEAPVPAPAPAATEPAQKQAG